MNSAKQFINEHFEDIVTDVLHVTSIASPPSEEQPKVAYLRQRIGEYSQLKNITIDREGNLSAVYPGSNGGTILLVAHVDTALKLSENIIRRDEKYLYGHGVCDNTAGVSALLYLLKYLDSHSIIPFYSLYFLFSVGEEGIGGKRGIKYFLENHNGIDAAINVESHNIGRVTVEANGLFRAKITIKASGGHSWRDFGEPNPVVISSNLIAVLSGSPLYEPGRTTCNFTTSTSSEPINAISSSASFVYEFRTNSPDDYIQLCNLFEKELDRIRVKYPEVDVGVQIISDVEPVSGESDNPLIKYLESIHKKLGIATFFSTANTDGDISIQKGIPTITIGASNGFKTHTPNEHLETNSLKTGFLQVFSVVEHLAKLALFDGKGTKKHV